MAPPPSLSSLAGKRKAAGSDADDSDDELERATPASQKKKTKQQGKQRRSDGPVKRARIAADDDDDDEEEEEEGAAAMEIEKKKIAGDDDDDDADEEDDDDEEKEEDAGAVLRRIERNAATAKKSLAAVKAGRQQKQVEAGIVKRLVVENFMCHQHLAINFGRNINFIHGENGSGKSALLTALMFVLGTKGLARERGSSSIKTLIKEKANYCRVKLTLYNQGDDAFQHDIYGDEIVIERESKSGRSAATAARLLAVSLAAPVRPPFARPPFHAYPCFPLRVFFAFLSPQL